MIRFTFYTDRDDFSYTQTVDEAREWLRSRGRVRSVEVDAHAKVSVKLLEDLADADVGRWVVAVSMGIVRKKAEAGGYISFFTDRRSEWVSIYADRIQSIGSAIEDDDDADPDSDQQPRLAGRLWTLWTDDEPSLTD